ncbi:MAG: hypothetical protein QHH10_13665 [Peptococcaceae bacterium]|jgi:hypothetical protein|nr:hypothetical protein [Peptococcaceae bacterium]MDH7526342.1 hypothetical protein [Peptococcaceae bacterium]
MDKNKTTPRVTPKPDKTYTSDLMNEEIATEYDISPNKGDVVRGSQRNKAGANKTINADESLKNK